MAPQQQNGQVRVGGDQLEPPRRHHRDLACFGDHGRRRAVAHGIFDDGQKRVIVARSGMDHIGRKKPGLRQPGRVEVVARAYPQNRSASMAGLACGNPGEEQGGGRVIGERACPWSDFVKCSCPQAASG